MGGGRVINIERQSRLSPEELIARLKKHFGKWWWGLEMETTQENPSCLSFRGGGGYVKATVFSEKGKTRVKLVSQEWEYQVEEFVSQLP
jgi:hypothetical protein